MRRMDRISVRSDDMLIIRGVNVFPSQIEEIVLQTPSLAPHYLLEVTREGVLDEVTLHVESAPGVDPASCQRHATQHLKHQVKAMVGISLRVSVGECGSIERSAGKARRVIDRRRSL